MAKAQADELTALADEKGAVQWKAMGAIQQGAVAAMTGEPSDAAQKIAAGIAAFRATGANATERLWLAFLARGFAKLGRFADAWRCIGEAVTAVETTKERWGEAEINRVAGEIS
jgi:hypothetical protein